MAPKDPTTPWHDASWRVSGDNQLQRGLRMQQGWWRQNRAGRRGTGIAEAGPYYPTLPPAPPPPPNNPLVVSTLPESCTDLSTNLMWPEAIAAFDEAKSMLNSAAGILQEDRLRRNLLSSQPLCFNLFGYLSQQSDLNALLPWVRVYSPRASKVTRILLEYAPTEQELGEVPLGGSAFDAFVEYEVPEGSLGFIGVETKYHENLSRGLELPKASGPGARTKYEVENERWPWRSGAAAVLLRHRMNLQFWYNQLLAQRTHGLVEGGHKYVEFTELVVATRVDASAKAVVNTVREQLQVGQQDTLRFCPIDEVLRAVDGHEDWKAKFIERYTDFTPIQAHLPARSPLKEK